MTILFVPPELIDFDTFLVQMGNKTDEDLIQQLILRLTRGEPGAIGLLMHYPASSITAVQTAILEIMKSDVERYAGLFGTQIVSHFFTNPLKPAYNDVVIAYLEVEPQGACVVSVNPLINYPSIADKVNAIFNLNPELKQIADEMAMNPHTDPTPEDLAKVQTEGWEPPAPIHL